MKSIKSFYPIFVKIMIICTFVFAMQFCDTFSTELFDKLQSLYTTDFLIIGKQMEAGKALSFLSLINFPFLLIAALTPLGKILVDICGRNRVYFMNICLLILGCVLCILAPNIYLFLLGNAMITFSCSLDIHYIYIVQEISPQYRATIRGITAGISALAAMLLPAFRSLFISHLHLSWRYLYIIAILLCIFLLILSAIQLMNVTPDQPHTKSANFSPKALNADNSLSKCLNSMKHYIFSIFKQAKFRNYALILLILGSATAGISYYNEPLLSFGIRGEVNINQVLFIQPIALFICSISFGILADRINRRFMLILCTICSCIFLPAFCFTANSSISPVFPAIFWGLMYGSYYSTVNLLQLMIAELADNHSIGKMSAIAVIIYGFGDAIGILCISLLVSHMNIMMAKLLTALPVLVIGMILLFNRKIS